MRRVRSTVAISICIPPFAGRCIASLRCSRPTPGIFRLASTSCCRPAGWMPSCGIPKRAAPSPISPAKSSPRKAPPGAGESDAVRRQRSQPRSPLPTRRSGPGFLTRRYRRATKRQWTTSWSRESIIKREGEFTLNLAANVENFTALPAGYEIARQAEKRWVVQARPPISSFPMPGSPPVSAPGCCCAPRLFASHNQPEETP